jgi:hypothetical protein
MVALKLRAAELAGLHLKAQGQERQVWPINQVWRIIQVEPVSPTPTLAHDTLDLR